MESKNKVNICGVQIDNASFVESVERIEYLLRLKKPCFLVTPNVDHIVRFSSDKQFQSIYSNAALVLADGMPLLWAASFLGTPLKEKVSGSDLFPEICKIAAEKGYRVFFMGGRETAASEAAKVLIKRFPGLNVVGTYCPRLGFEEDENLNNEIVAKIKESKADIVFVGLGSPKQENWIYKYMNFYQAPVSMGIGVSFEFFAGIVKRAPVWMQKSGLEWFWRLMMEPKRLWKRYLVDDIRFFELVLRQKLSPNSFSE